MVVEVLANGEQRGLEIEGVEARLRSQDVDPTVRARAALAIGRVGMAEGGAALTAALSDTDPLVRAQAAFALGLLGRAEAAPALTQALGDPDVMDDAMLATNAVRRSMLCNTLRAAVLGPDS